MAFPRWWWSNHQATQPSRFHTETLWSIHWLFCDAPLGAQVLAKSPECLQMHCDVLKKKKKQKKKKKNCKVEIYFPRIWSQQNSFSLHLFYFHAYPDIFCHFTLLCNSHTRLSVISPFLHTFPVPNLTLKRVFLESIGETAKNYKNT